MGKLLSDTLSTFPGINKTGIWVDANNNINNIRKDMDKKWIENTIEFLKRAGSLECLEDRIDAKVATDEEIEVYYLYKEKIKEFEEHLEYKLYKR